MTVTIQSIVASAEQEWSHWGQSTWDLVRGKRKIVHRDDDVDYAKYVLEQYCSITGSKPTVSAIQNDDFFWSAVGMSAIMKRAGFTKKQFPFAASHSRFIASFVKARKSASAVSPYWGYAHKDPAAKPEVGDIVAYARGASAKPAALATLIDRNPPYESHTDVVVAKRDGEIDVIGANVMDSVTRKTLPLDADGHIGDTEHPWFAVLKFRAAPLAVG